MWILKSPEHRVRSDFEIADRRMIPEVDTWPLCRGSTKHIDAGIRKNNTGSEKKRLRSIKLQRH